MSSDILTSIKSTKYLFETCVFACVSVCLIYFIIFLPFCSRKMSISLVRMQKMRHAGGSFAIRSEIVWGSSYYDVTISTKSRKSSWETQRENDEKASEVDIDVDFPRYTYRRHWPISVGTNRGFTTLSSRIHWSLLLSILFMSCGRFWNSLVFINFYCLRRDSVFL